MTNPDHPEPSRNAKRKIDDLRGLIRPPRAALRIWDRILTDEDRERLVANQDRERRLANEKLSDEDRKALSVDWQFAYWIHQGTAGMWMYVRGVSYARAVIDVAFELRFLDSQERDWLRREIGELYDDFQRTVDVAIVQNLLVLIESPRQAFWKREQIEIDWHQNNAEWNFFWKLCCRSKRSQSVTYLDLGERVSSSALSTRKARLVDHENFPDELDGLIRSMRGSGYQLDLPPEEIRFFLVEEFDRIVEWKGDAPLP